MKKAITLILILTVYVSGYSQTFSSLTAFSGSLAPWGTNQRLTINSSGNAKIYTKVVETGVADSASMTLTSGQMQAIVDTAVTAGFFSLSAHYNSGAVDGSGISLKIVTSTSSNTSEARNICVNAMNRVVRTINTQILTTGKQLEYGHLDEVCP